MQGNVRPAVQQKPNLPPDSTVTTTVITPANRSHFLLKLKASFLMTFMLLGLSDEEEEYTREG